MRNHFTAISPVVKIDFSKWLALLLWYFKLIGNQQKLIRKTDICRIIDTVKFQSYTGDSIDECSLEVSHVLQSCAEFNTHFASNLYDIWITFWSTLAQRRSWPGGVHSRGPEPPPLSCPVGSMQNVKIRWEFYSYRGVGVGRWGLDSCWWQICPDPLWTFKLAYAAALAVWFSFDPSFSYIEIVDSAPHGSFTDDAVLCLFCHAYK